MASYPSGKGLVCKTIMHRFDSDRRLCKMDASSTGASFFCLPECSSKAAFRLYIFTGYQFVWCRCFFLLFPN